MNLRFTPTNPDKTYNLKVTSVNCSIQDQVALDPLSLETQQLSVSQHLLELVPLSK